MSKFTLVLSTFSTLRFLGNSFETSSLMEKMTWWIIFAAASSPSQRKDGLASCKLTVCY